MFEMSDEVANALCDAFALGTPQRVASVRGGLQHQMFQVRTERGVWAVKKLNPNALRDEAARARFARCEAVAKRAHEAGLPAMTAREGSDGVLFQANADVYLVYEWAEGVTLSPASVGERRAKLLGGLLAQLHALKIRFPDQSAPAIQAFTAERWRELSQRGCESSVSWADEVADALPQLLQANEKAQRAGEALQADWVNGHGDYDQKNVLWRDEAHADAPLILDWEQSGPWHPAQEAMGAGLCWAGQSSGATDYPAFKAFLDGYREVAPLRDDELRIASDGVLGKWLIWLEFNLARTLDSTLSSDELQIARDCSHHALGATLGLLRDAPEREMWCRRASSGKLSP